MIFSVSNDGFKWCLDSGRDSVTFTVKGLVHEMTLITKVIHLAAWTFLFSQRQEFLNNHLARVLITPKQEGTMEMRHELLSSVDAQNMDTNEYQVPSLEDSEFHCGILT